MDEDEKPPLRLVEKPRKQAASNFWRCCALSREYLPETPCPEGQAPKKGDEPRCPWWINSSPHNFCFWRYVKDKSDKDGLMKELVQSELAALFGWSNTKTHFMLKQAMTQLAEALKLNGAAELLQELDAEESLDVVVPEEFPEVSSDDPSE